ncbi:pyridoxamine 5'-phosphate oxidase family protein [Ammoniphilus sp. CFH 90114]|uniref:pyridoxamine 5'-phosphate oxidase family protein n=1 Tax=Ammoniphilus sp. CFH 90114 TaxID=2493665 RepID=UPI00100F758F|nr:pyridoxamine 5'-phosphate oxidase family protein [Ammoniphilus sp. CFH 90114]RXT04260.1 hypothetical protein EIZ39_20470 [Ammoniphilus sp. CFH 90114]
MAQEQQITLNDLQAYLQGEKLVFLSTVDAETNTPSVSAISWVKMYDENSIRFSISSNSRIVDNLKSNPRVTLALIGLESVYSVIGECNIIEEKMEGIAMRLAKIELKVENIFNSMFWGAKIVQEPLYEKTYDLEKAKKLDEEVYALLMK